MNHPKQKLLITGSLGFIASNFIRKFKHEGAPYQFIGIDKVANMDLLPTTYKSKEYTLHIGDFADAHFINVIFAHEKPDVVIHMGASTHVDVSLKDPNIFIHDNVLGTQCIINACLKYKVKKMVYVSCYDEQTRAATRSGMKHYSDLKEGDLILSINPDTGIVEEKAIEKIIVQDYDGDMLHFTNNRSDLLTTPNHRFLCAKEAKKDTALEWYNADELEKLVGNFYLPRGKNINSSSKTITVPDIGEVDSQAFFYVCGVFIGDGFTAYQEQIVPNKSGYSKKDLLIKARDPKTGRLIKLNERGPQDTTTQKCYRIFFDVPEHDKARYLLEQSLTILGIKYTCQKGNAGEHVYFSSEKWLKFFDSFGKYAKNKHIPEWLFSYGQESLYALWRGIHDSDGYGFGLDKTTVRITTVSEKLTQQLCYLGSMIGFQTRFETKYNESYLDGRKISGWCNVIYFADINRVHLPKPVRQQYSGKIWCLKIADNKNFLVERNGKIAYCGNTDEVYGSLSSESDPPWTEESPLAPRNPYSASKAAAELLVRAAGNSFGLPFCITRSSNCFGRWQYRDKFLPKVIRCIIRNEPIPIYAKGQNIRDWLFVNDNCDGVMMVLEKGVLGETYNITAGNELSNLELVQRVCNIMGRGHDLISFVEDRSGHDFRYAINADKIRALGWVPKSKFGDALSETVQWYYINRMLFGDT